MSTHTFHKAKPSLGVDLLLAPLTTLHSGLSFPTCRGGVRGGPSGSGCRCHTREGRILLAVPGDDQVAMAPLFRAPGPGDQRTGNSGPTGYRVGEAASRAARAPGTGRGKADSERKSKANYFRDYGSRASAGYGPFFRADKAIFRGINFARTSLLLSAHNPSYLPICNFSCLSVLSFL